ncbi:MAG: MBL fold metallo-hydrolase [Ruminococcaceae bacterium]|nr:MBL fold metallo-hydrolase [Oscillospiraceae bacterium]
MKITFIGQAGLMFENENIRFMIDPYLSDSVGKVSPEKHRRVPVKEELFDEKLDLIILTHDHLDHTDPETLEVLLNKNKNLEILAPYNAWNKVRQYGNNHNYILFDKHTTWTSFGIKFTAVKACHSDLTAIGVIIDDGNKKFYVTGDTLYNSEIFDDLPDDIYAVFLPINGVGNNMNITDAKNFAKKCNAKYIVPIHFGMFDNINPLEFNLENTVIPQIYKIIEFNKE